MEGAGWCGLTADISSKDNCLTRSKVKNGSTKYDDQAPNESYFSTDPTIDPAFNGL